MRQYIRFVPLLAFASAAFAVACGASPDSKGGVGTTEAPSAGQSPAPEAQSKATSAAGIHGTLLYTKTVATGHVVDFYEFTPGAVAIHESYSIDSGEKPLVDTTHAASLAEFYAQLNPGERAVPSAILDADQRALELASAAEAVGAPPTMTATEVPAVDNAITAGASGTCSADLNHDAWAAQWFLNNFCNAGAFRSCLTNNGQISTSSQSSAPWMSWRQLEGDFNLTGHITGDHWHCDSWWPGVVACGWVMTTDFDYDTQPRSVQVWNWNPASHAEVVGRSQCGHCDVALLWNN